MGCSVCYVDDISSSLHEASMKGIQMNETIRAGYDTLKLLDAEESNGPRRAARIHVYYSDHPDIDVIRHLANHPGSNTYIIEINVYTAAYRKLKTLTCIELKGEA